MENRPTLWRPRIAADLVISHQEMEIIARSVAEKLNRYKEKGLDKVVIPRKGFSSLSVEGGVLYDPVADRAFVDELKKNLDPKIRIREVEAHINTPEFARAVVEALQKSFATQAKKPAQNKE